MMLAANVVFIIGYRAGDKETMYLPIFFILAVFLGVGYQALLDWVRNDPNRTGTRAATCLLQILMVAAVVISAVFNWTSVDRSQDWSARERGERILQTVEPHAIVAGYFHTAPVVQYLQLVEGHRPDVFTINRFLIDPPDLMTFLRDQADHRPVYVDQLSHHMAGFEIIRAEPLFRLILSSYPEIDTEQPE